MPSDIPLGDSDDRIVLCGTDLGLELLVVGEEGVIVGLDGVELAL